MPKPPRPRRISELLDEPGTALAGLSRSAGANATLLSAIAEALPPPLREHLLSAAVADGTLTLSVSSATQASRLRFHEGPCLAAASRISGATVRSVRVRVAR